MPRATWTGAIAIAGLPVHVQVYNAAPATRDPSFKLLCPCHDEPIEQVNRCVPTSTVIPYEDLHRGIVLDDGSIAPLEEEELTALKELTDQRTVMAEIVQLPPADTIPWDLAIGRFSVVPNAKMPGSDNSLGLLWNGLSYMGAALITHWIKRKGSKPALVAVRAEPNGTLTAVELPYATQLREDEIPTHYFTYDEAQAQMFAMFAQQMRIDTDDFVHDAFVDTVAAKRAELVAAKMAGTPLPPKPDPQKAPAAPDLMAVMAAAIAAAKENADTVPSGEPAPAPAPAKAAAPAKKPAKTIGGVKVPEIAPW